MLHVDNLSCQILKGISFSLEKNNNLTILGSNGSGKTTLAKAICHLIYNDSVKIEGKNVAHLSAKQRAQYLNFIPAKLSIYDEYFTVWDYLKLNIYKEEQANHLDTVLKLLKIAHLKNSRCHKLSSGESALLLTGGAMIHQALYTILDEPTANLDQAKKVTVYQLLKNSLYFRNKIIITHDLNLAYKLGYNILFLEEGEVHYHGACEPFFEQNHLECCFGNSIKNVDGNFVVNYDETL
ncbi:MAG: ABC transporter ATP-binding protein [Sulfuricurvum sp.]|nr:ABC transporter ATP-binding protein [Sulfuricurvum sp.]